MIQLNAMADRIIPDKRNWDKSCRFMGDVASSMQREVEKALQESKGPTFWKRWVGWKSTNHEQLINQAVQEELRKVLDVNPVGTSHRCSSSLFISHS